MQTEEILIVINIFDVHKNQQPPRRHLEFLPESKIRIHFLFIFRNINKFTCSFVLFHVFCMIVCTGKLYTEIISSDLRIYLNLVFLAGIVVPRYLSTGADPYVPWLTQISEIGVWGSGLARKIESKVLWASPAGRFSKKLLMKLNKTTDTAGPSYLWDSCAKFLVL